MTQTSTSPASDTERNTDYNLGFDDGLAVGKAASDTEAMRLLREVRKMLFDDHAPLLDVAAFIDAALAKGGAA